VTDWLYNNLGMLRRIINSFNSLSVIEKTFLTFLLVSQVFYFYRYAFRLGSPFSPPGYTLTPSIIQFAKYPLAAIFFLVIAGLIINKFGLQKIKETIAKQKFWTLLLIFFAYITVSLLKFGISPTSFAITQNAKMLFVLPFVIFIPFVVKEGKTFDLFKLFVILSVIYHTAYSLIAGILFITAGRLPGLAFSNLLPRYGGGWDDPNGFAIMMLLLLTAVITFYSDTSKSLISKYLDRMIAFLPVQIFKKQDQAKERVSDILVASIIMMFLFAYSLTSLLGLAVAVGLLIFFRSLSFTKAAIIGGAIAVFGAIHFKLHLIDLLIKAKTASSEGHIYAENIPQSASKVPGGLDPFSYIIGAHGQAIFHENTYLQFFFNFGMVGTALFIMILLTSTIAALRGFLKFRNKNSFERVVFLTGFVYIITFSVISVGLPLVQVYPINLFSWIVVGLVWSLSPLKDWKEILGLDLLLKNE
jgi:hypothetical protein